MSPSEVKMAENLRGVIVKLREIINRERDEFSDLSVLEDFFRIMDEHLQRVESNEEYVRPFITPYGAQVRRPPICRCTTVGHWQVRIEELSDQWISVRGNPGVDNWPELMCSDCTLGRNENCVHTHAVLDLWEAHPETMPKLDD